MNAIGKKITDARKIKGMSQEELAELSKVNLRTIQRIENNESEARGKTLSLICDVLEINLADLLNSKSSINENKIDTNLVFGYKLASKGTRFLATLTDAIICMTVIWTPYIIYKVSKNDFHANDIGTTNIGYQAVYVLFVGALFYPMFSGNLGHRIFNLKVISSETGNNFDKASDGAIREFLKGFLCYLVIPSIWILWDEKNQNLYDKLTKTYVVEKEK